MSGGSLPSLPGLQIRYQRVDLLGGEVQVRHVGARLHPGRVRQPVAQVDGVVQEDSSGEGRAAAEVREVRTKDTDEPLHAVDGVTSSATLRLHDGERSGRRRLRAL